MLMTIFAKSLKSISACAGGTSTMLPMLPPAIGLSPRVRGNHLYQSAGGGEQGSIPACAGEPTPGARLEQPTGVYPRVCGGTKNIRRRNIAKCGLSPRVRGNLRAYRHLTPALRSIPACAGEPRSGQCRRVLYAVYPRVCGGTAGCYAAQSAARGLSPRVRGNPASTAACAAIIGSIPACAGEPGAIDAFRNSHGVYPRVCGGTRPVNRGCYRFPGLSPRVRGNRISPTLATWYAGSIPACAGEPVCARRQ